jgi:hypothetical protein
VAWLESPDGLDATAEFQVREKSSTKIFRNFCRILGLFWGSHRGQASFY